MSAIALIVVPVASEPISQALEEELYFSTLPFATPVVSTSVSAANVLETAPGTHLLPAAFQTSASPFVGPTVFVSTSLKPLISVASTGGVYVNTPVPEA